MSDFNDPVIPRIPGQRSATDLPAGTATPADAPKRLVIGEREYHVRNSVYEIWDRRIGAHVYRFAYLNKGDLRKERLHVTRRALDDGRPELVREVWTFDVITRSTLREAAQIAALHDDCDTSTCAYYQAAAARLIGRLTEYGRRYL